MRDFANFVVYTSVILVLAQVFIYLLSLSLCLLGFHLLGVATPLCGYTALFSLIAFLAAFPFSLEKYPSRD